MLKMMMISRVFKAAFNTVKFASTKAATKVVKTKAKAPTKTATKAKATKKVVKKPTKAKAAAKKVTKKKVTKKKVTAKPKLKKVIKKKKITLKKKVKKVIKKVKKTKRKVLKLIKKKPSLRVISREDLAKLRNTDIGTYNTFYRKYKVSALKRNPEFTLSELRRLASKRWLKLTPEQITVSIIHHSIVYMHTYIV